MHKFLSNYLNIKYIKPLYYNYFKKYRPIRTFVTFCRYNVFKVIHTVFLENRSDQKKFICTLPWDHAAIKAHGGVTCSTASRGRDELFFGNINESSFIDIWHGKKFQTHRQNIRDPKTKLSHLCYTCPYKDKYTDISDKSLKPAYPKVLWVESTDKCNLKCPVCIHTNDRGGFSLSMKRYTQIMAEVGPHLQNLHFFLDGENYIHPKATEMTRFAKKINPDIQIHTSTNGLLFDDPVKQEDFARSGVDRAVFSIDGANQESYSRYRKGGQLDLVLDNMRGIVEIKNKLGIPLHVQWRYILFEWNDSEEEMDKARELASDIGVDSLAWLITTTVYHSKRFFLSHINEYNVKLPNEYFEPSYMGLKEKQLDQKLV